MFKVGFLQTQAADPNRHLRKDVPHSSRIQMTLVISWEGVPVGSRCTHQRSLHPASLGTGQEGHSPPPASPRGAVSLATNPGVGGHAPASYLGAPVAVVSSLHFCVAAFLSRHLLLCRHRES